MDVQLPSGTVTFLTTDIVGFSALFERNAELARSLTLRQAEIIGETVTEHGGAVFKIVGDAVWAAFATAPSAVACALSISSAIRESPDLEGLRIRTALLTGEATPVGGDYLERVLNRCSRLCGKAKGEQILVGGSTYELTRSDFRYRPLGELELRGVPNESAWELLGEQGGTEVVRARAPLKQRAGTLPEEERRFVGRERERNDLHELVIGQSSRLVTVTGMGGIGKTRLCLEVARASSGEFADGVCLVPCDTIRGEEELVAAILAGLELERDQATLPALTDQLAELRTLLVLDSFERLVAHRAVIDEILAKSRYLKILVSSRVLLGLPREFELALGPMTSRGAHGGTSDASTLFWEAAERVAPRLRPSKGHLRTVHQIVEVLEGVPLAILLAASRLSHMTLEELLAQVRSRRLKTLKRTPVGTGDRHMNLIRVIGDSFDLLGRPEMQLMVDLSCFHGFYMEDALAILGSVDEIYEGIARLRDNSLLSVQTMGARMRFRILDTVREYIEEQLADWARAEVAFGHAVHFTRRAIEMKAKIDEGAWKTTNAVLWLEMGNFRQAIYLASKLGDAGLLEDQARALARPLAEAGLQSDFELLRVAVQDHSEEIAPDALAEVYGLQGMLAQVGGRTDEALKAWTTSAELWRAVGDVGREADVLVDVCDVALLGKKMDEARHALVVYDELCAQASVGVNVAASGQILHARLALAEGDRDGAASFADQALAMTEHIPQEHTAIYILGGLGEIYCELGNLDGPEALFLRALRYAAEGNYVNSARRLLLDLVELYLRLNMLEKAGSCAATILNLPAAAKEQTRHLVRNRVEEARAKLGPDRFGAIQKELAAGPWTEIVGLLLAIGPC